MLHTLYGRSLAFDTTYMIEFFALDLIMQVIVIIIPLLSVMSYYVMSCRGLSCVALKHSAILPCTNPSLLTRFSYRNPLLPLPLPLLHFFLSGWSLCGCNLFEHGRRHHSSHPRQQHYHRHRWLRQSILLLHQVRVAVAAVEQT